MKTLWLSYRGLLWLGSLAAATCSLCTLPAAAHPSFSNGYQTPGPHAHVNGTNVLVIYNAAWADDDSNGVNDSFEVAQYYAQRRAIPTNNLLGVTVTNYLDTFWKDYVSYECFYSNILVPVVQKLNSTNAATGQPFLSNIYYLCPVYGVPPDVDTYFDDSDNPMAPYNNDRRSLDAYLMHALLMFDNGLYFTNGNNRPGVVQYARDYYSGFGAMWGDLYYEVGYGNLLGWDGMNRYYDDADDPSTSAHFRAKRDAEWPAMYWNSYGYFLVTRIDAPTKDCAIGIIDKTLYAERYIRNWAGHAGTGYYGRIYADEGDQNFGGGYYAPLIFADGLGCDIKNWFRGDPVGNAAKSVFAPGITNALAPWDWVQDSQSSEIGFSGALPIVSNLVLGALRGSTASVYYCASTTSFYYYVAGAILRGFEGRTMLSSSGGMATILAVGTNDARLAWGDIVLSTPSNFYAGNILTVTNIETFALPLGDVMWYNAYYQHSYYPDAFQWLPGSVGIHNESYPCKLFRRAISNNFFAGRALLRGLTAIPGAVNEPFEVGLPFSRKFYRAFCQGFDFAESCYQSTPCAVAWMDCFIGDPLYNPFMALYENSNRFDSTAPALSATNPPGTLAIVASLLAGTADEAADIAQFRLYAGPTSNNWAITNDFVYWPNPASSAWDASRQYGWSRSYQWTFAPATSWTYFQVTARDPYGNMTVSPVHKRVVITSFVDITNLPAVTSVPSSNTTQYVAGTNNIFTVGTIWWTNTLNGVNGTVPVTSDKFQVTSVPLSVGSNVIVVAGTDVLGLVSYDTAVVIRVTVPFADITNGSFSVAYDVSQAMVGGTNIAAIGTMQLQCRTGAVVNYAVSLTAAASWSAMVSNLVADVTNMVTMAITNVMGEPASGTVGVFRPRPPGNPADVEQFMAGRGANYSQMSLSWSNGTVTVLACTNRTYPSDPTDPTNWTVLASGVSSPWTHTAASNFPSVYYRIVSGVYTSLYDVGKFDVNIAAGSIAWMSFPFSVQLSCGVLSEWFGQQLEARPYSGYNFPSLQKQATPGGTVQNADYYINDFSGGQTNWFSNDTIVANAGYVLFLPRDHRAASVTTIGMVQTNNVTMQIPYQTVPWVALAYPVSLGMRLSGLADLLAPPKPYSLFNYDYIASQQMLGGSAWYAEYYIDNWGSGTTNFFPSQPGADSMEGGKGYLLFFSTTRSGTGVWTCVKPY